MKKRRLVNIEKLNRWLNDYDEGPKLGMMYLARKAQCHFTMIDKMAKGDYPHEPSYWYRTAICKATGYDEEVLFPWEK